MVRALTLVPTFLCAAAIVSAQAPAAQPPSYPATQQTAQPSQGQSMAAGKVTYSGCVRPGTVPGTFILDNAQLAPVAGAASAQSGSAVGTSGTMKTTLNLTTKPETDLKAHTNHKIEVVGMMAPAKSTPAASTEPGQPAAAKPALEFNVDSIKMVSTSCQ